MKTVSQKLKSHSGISMLFALLLFVIAIIVGVIAITAASVSVGRVVHVQEYQQDYLSVRSGVLLLREQLQSANYVGSYRKVRHTYTYTDSEGNSHQRTYYTYHTDSSAPIDSCLESWLQEDIDSLYQSQNPIAYGSISFSSVVHNLSLATDNTSISNLMISTYIDDEYNLFITLETEEHTNPMTLTLKAEVVKTSNTVGNTTTYLTTVTWPESKISKGTVIT